MMEPRGSEARGDPEFAATHGNITAVGRDQKRPIRTDTYEVSSPRPVPYGIIERAETGHLKLTEVRYTREGMQMFTLWIQRGYLNWEIVQIEDLVLDRTRLHSWHRLLSGGQNPVRLLVRSPIALRTDTVYAYTDYNIPEQPDQPPPQATQ